VKFTDIYREGITHVTPFDISMAAEFGYRIKLLAIAKGDRDWIEARVHPTLIRANHVLANVEGVHNAIFVEGEPLIEAMLFGHGAGMMPTAGAVMGDVVEVARDMLAGSAPHRAPMRAWPEDARKRVPIHNIMQRKGEYYLRCTVVDRPGVLSRIASTLGKNSISIARVIQKGRDVKGTVPIFLLTHEAQEKNLAAAVRQMDKLNVVKGKTVFIRIEE
jgi:homoserine dehydrogenase